MFQSREVYRLEFQLPSGIWIDWMLMPEFDQSGRVQTVIASARDITDRKLAEDEKARLEDQIRQLNKMEAVGRLTGGVAHDFNNMLSAIIGHSEMALMRCTPEDASHKDLTAIHAAAKKSADITRQLLAFARRQAAAPKVLDINYILDGMLKIL